MKLLLCTSCSDVVKLRKTETLCECGKSKGRYIDALNAEYSGDYAYLLGFHNGSLVKALQDQNRYGDSEIIFEHGVYAGEAKGREFTAFIIPDSAKTVTKLN